MRSRRGSFNADGYRRQIQRRLVLGGGLVLLVLGGGMVWLLYGRTAFLTAAACLLAAAAVFGLLWLILALLGLFVREDKP